MEKKTNKMTPYLTVYKAELLAISSILSRIGLVFVGILYIVDVELDDDDYDDDLPIFDVGFTSNDFGGFFDYFVFLSDFYFTVLGVFFFVLSVLLIDRVYTTVEDFRKTFIAIVCVGFLDSLLILYIIFKDMDVWS